MVEPEPSFDRAYRRCPRSPFANAKFLATGASSFARSRSDSTILNALAPDAVDFRTAGVVEGLIGTGFALVLVPIELPGGWFVDAYDANRSCSPG